MALPSTFIQLSFQVFFFFFSEVLFTYNFDDFKSGQEIQLGQLTPPLKNQVLRLSKSKNSKY